MKKMYISFAKELRNIEFRSLFNSLDNLLNRKKTDTPLIIEAAKRIKVQNEKLRQLKFSKPDKQLTNNINEKLHRRTKYLASFRMELKAKQINYLPENRKAANKLLIWLDRYKKDLYKPSPTTQSNLVNSMIDDRKKIPIIQQYITFLGLDGLLDEIKRITDDVFEDRQQRSKETTQNKMAMEGLRDAAYDDLKVLESAVLMDYITTTDEEKKKEISALSESISTVLKENRTKFRSRRTKSRKRRALNTANKELIGTDEKQLPAKNNLPMVIYDGLKMNIGQKTAKKNSINNLSQTPNNRDKTKGEGETNIS